MISSQVYAFGRKQLNLKTGMLTGNCKLKGHLHTMGLTIENMWPQCKGFRCNAQSFKQQ